MPQHRKLLKAQLLSLSTQQTTIPSDGLQWLTLQAAWVEAVSGHIKSTQRAGSRAIALGEEEDGATDVQEVETQRFERNVFYNLNGQKVDNPSRGIFLYNGRKVIINK